MYIDDKWDVPCLINLEDIPVSECFIFHGDCFMKTSKLTPGVTMSSSAAALPLFVCLNLRTGDVIELLGHDEVMPINAKVYIVKKYRSFVKYRDEFLAARTRQ